MNWKIYWVVRTRREKQGEATFSLPSCEVRAGLALVCGLDAAGGRYPVEIDFAAKYDARQLMFSHHVARPAQADRPESAHLGWVLDEFMYVFSESLEEEQLGRRAEAWAGAHLTIGDHSMVNGGFCTPLCRLLGGRVHRCTSICVAYPGAASATNNLDPTPAQ